MQREGVKIERAMNSNRARQLGLSCKASKCSDAGTGRGGEVGVLTSLETPSVEMVAGSTRPW